MFAVLRFPNFSVSGVATLGAFAGYVAYGAGLQMAGSLSPLPSPWPGVGRTRLRQGGAPAADQAGRACRPPSPRIATGLILENVVRLGFGNEPRGYDRPIARDVFLGDIRVSPQQLETMGLGAAADAAGVRRACLHPHRQGHARLGRQSRACGAEGHPARAHRHAGELRRHGLVGVGGMLLGSTARSIR
jgi:hypothetical protein